MNFDLYGFGPALAAGALMTVKLALTALCLGLVLGLACWLTRDTPVQALRESRRLTEALGWAMVGMIWWKRRGRERERREVGEGEGEKGG